MALKLIASLPDCRVRKQGIEGLHHCCCVTGLYHLPRPGLLIATSDQTQAIIPGLVMLCSCLYSFLALVFPYLHLLPWWLQCMMPKSYFIPFLSPWSPDAYNLHSNISRADPIPTTSSYMDLYLKKWFHQPSSVYTSSSHAEHQGSGMIMCWGGVLIQSPLAHLLTLWHSLLHTTLCFEPNVGKHRSHQVPLCPESSHSSFRPQAFNIAW
jgi:hypothetical protein